MHAWAITPGHIHSAESYAFKNLGESLLPYRYDWIAAWF